MKAARWEPLEGPGEERARLEELRAACGEAARSRPPVAFQDQGDRGFVLEELGAGGDLAVLMLAPRVRTARIFRRWGGDPGAEMYGLPVDLSHGFRVRGESYPSAELAAAALLRELHDHLAVAPPR